LLGVVSIRRSGLLSSSYEGVNLSLEHDAGRQEIADESDCALVAITPMFEPG